jgi:hypothetical protein
MPPLPENMIDYPLTSLRNLLTVYGDGKVNVNAADMDVLMTLPAIDDIYANEIIEDREGVNLEEDELAEIESTSFENVADFNARFPEVAGLLNGRISTDSGVYRLTCIGKVGEVERTIRCVVNLKDKKLLVLRWNESGTI